MLKVLIASLIGFKVFLAQAVVLEEWVNKNCLEARLSYKKIGYYSGSFDPLHLGHEAISHHLLQQKVCDYVLFYPAWGGDAYKKRADIKWRLKMLFATFKDHPQIIVTKLAPGCLAKYFNAAGSL